MNQFSTAHSLTNLRVVRGVCVRQKMVDEAEPFPAVLQRVVLWLQEHQLGTTHKYALLTDG